MPSVEFLSGEYYAYGDTAIFDSQAELSWSIWGNFNGNTADINLFTKGSGTADMFSCWRDESALSGAKDVITGWLEESSGNNVRAQTDNGTIANTGQWYHVGGVYSGTSNDSVFIIYADGAAGSLTDTPDSATTSSSVGGSVSFKIGEGYDPGDAKLAYPCFWNVRLSASEMSALAAGCSPLRIRPGNITFFAPLGLVDDNMFGTETVTPSGTPAIGADSPPVEHPFRSVSRTLVAFPAGGAPPVGGAVVKGSLALLGVGK